MKKLLPVLSLAVVLLALGGYFVLTQKNTSKPTETSSQTTSPVATDTEANLSTPTAGQYVTYRDGIIEETQGVKILFFHASWCRQCRDIETSIGQKGVPEGVTIIKIDYDTNTALKKKYGVTLQTTLVRIDDQGNAVKKYVAYEEPHIDSIKRELL